MDNACRDRNSNTIPFAFKAITLIKCDTDTSATCIQIIVNWIFKITRLFTFVLLTFACKCFRKIILKGMSLCLRHCLLACYLPPTPFFLKTKLCLKYVCMGIQISRILLHFNGMFQFNRKIYIFYCNDKF